MRNRWPRLKVHRSVMNRRLCLAALRHQQRQDVAGRLVQATVEGADQALALGRLGQLVVLGRDAERQLLLGEREVGGILIGRDRTVAAEPQRTAQLGSKLLGIGDGRRRRRASPRR